MSKLTTTMKEHIIALVFADIPKPDHDNLKDEIQKALVKGMSVPCRNIYKKNPEALRTGYVNRDHGLRHQVTVVVGDADYKMVFKPFEDRQDERDAALQSFKSAVASCTTRKQFVDRFPELTSYLPNESTPCPTAPALANVVAGLVKVGFVPKVIKT